MLKFKQAIVKLVLMMCTVALIALGFVLLLLAVPDPTPIGNCYSPPTGCQ